MNDFKIWWLIPGQLGGMPIPLDESDLSEINKSGIRAVVNLLESFDNQNIYEKANLDFLWLPIPDFEAPTLKQVLTLKSFIDTQIAEQKPVSIHCFAGQGRTGTMLASWLISKGMSSKKAINQVRTVNPQAIESILQEAFLNRLPSLL